MAVTIKDIAKKVGVSPSTVSRVINGNSVISSKTRSRIVSAMEELNYHPNSLARNFVNGSTNAIGLVIDAQDAHTFANAFFNRSVYAIETVAQSNGYNLLITNDRQTPNGSSVEKLVFEKKVDGLILPSSIVKPKLIQTLTKNEFPFTVLGEPKYCTMDTSWVDINNSMGSEMAVKHLAKMGYQKIVFLLENLETVFIKNRIKGYENAMEQCGLFMRGDRIKECGQDLKIAYEVTLELLDSHTYPDAFLCSNNMIAFQVLKALKEKKIKVPEEVGVVTFDNYPIAEYMDPPLTAIDVDTFSLGEQVASNLVKKIHNVDSGNQQTFISTDLIIRESSTRKKAEHD